MSGSDYLFILQALNQYIPVKCSEVLNQYIPVKCSDYLRFRFLKNHNSAKVLKGCFICLQVDEKCQSSEIQSAYFKVLIYMQCFSIRSINLMEYILCTSVSWGDWHYLDS